MKTIQVLALAPSKVHNAEISRSLASLSCVVHEGYNGQDIGRIIRENEIHAVIFAGELPGLSAERILTAVAERVPQAVLIVSILDIDSANVLAARFKGHALPWPMRTESVKALLSGGAAQSFIVPRREIRWRMMSGANVYRAGEAFPSLLLNISHGGAMVLSDVKAQTGEMLEVVVPHAGSDFTLGGKVRHMGNHETVASALQEAPWLQLHNPLTFGLELTPESKIIATELCKQIREERALLNLRVTCIPGVPKSLTPVFQQFGIKVEALKNLPKPFDNPPPIVLIDVSTCSTEELEQLQHIRKRSVIIGIASMPITDKTRASHASALPGIFVLPFQNEALVSHIEDFFAPVDRKFPRIETEFTALLQMPAGNTLAAEGVNLSLHGCAVKLVNPIAPGTAVRGTLAMDQAIDAYPFRGEVIYCVGSEGDYRAGVTFRINPPADISYQKYLSVRFLKQLRKRWEHQLRTPAL